MTILVRQNSGGEWLPWVGPETVEQTIGTASLHYYDGRIEEIAVDPYPIRVMLDPFKVVQLFDEGTWDEDQLAEYGIKAVEPFVVPDGQVRIGAPRYVEVKGKVSEQYDTAAAPPPPTPEQKLLTKTGLTVTELKELLA